MRLFFTHVPKTAGTSFLKMALEPNWAVRKYSGLRKFFWDKWPENLCYVGHIPYGLHQLRPLQRVNYLTFIRQPVERAISHYFFVISTESEWYVHPELKVHEEIPIEDIFAYNRCRIGIVSRWGLLLDNMQTRYLAGIPFAHSKNEQKLLQRAKDNLHRRYTFWGLQDRYEESLEKFKSRFQVSVEVNSDRLKKSKKQELSDRQLAAVEEENRLDMELYEFAQKYF